MEESLRYASEIDLHFAMDETEPTVRPIFVSIKLLTSSRQVDIIYQWGCEVLPSVVCAFILADRDPCFRPAECGDAPRWLNCRIAKYTTTARTAVLTIFTSEEKRHCYRNSLLYMYCRRRGGKRAIKVQLLLLGEVQLVVNSTE